jgi:hypothetical protein
MFVAPTFDSYRSPDDRQAMIDFVMKQRGAMTGDQAVRELNSLNHVGLAHLYRDMLAASGQGHRIDYDPCEIGRM